jgi:hypothetical protein
VQWKKHGALEHFFVYSTIVLYPGKLRGFAVLVQTSVFHEKCLKGMRTGMLEKNKKKQENAVLREM